PYLCKAGSCTGVCTPNTTKCVANLLQTCGADGQYTGSQCPFICTPGTGTTAAQCTGICTPGALNCNNKTQQRCNEQAQWVDVQLCPFLCTGGQCSGMCQPGSKQYNITNPLIPQNYNTTNTYQNGGA